MCDLLALRDLLGSSPSSDLTAHVSTFRPQIHDVVRRLSDRMGSIARYALTWELDRRSGPLRRETAEES